MSPAAVKSSSIETSNEGLLSFDAKEFSEKFPSRGFKIRHKLAGHPAFTLNRLAELAQRLPPKQVEYYAGNVPVGQDASTHPGNGLSVTETVYRIQNCKSWMVLKNVETDPEYKALLDAALAPAYAASPKAMGRMHREEAFIFISSPHSVTPFHLDEEHNFLMQIHGSKQVSMWDPRDREVLPEPLIEHMLQIWHGDNFHRNLKYVDAYQQRAEVYELNPGDALHFPVGAPHWVKNGPEVSVSFSVTFRSNLSEKQAIVYFMNGKLRRMGLKPTPPNEAAWRDSFKYAAFQGMRRTVSLFAGSVLQRKQNQWA